MPEILTDAYLLFTFVFKQALNRLLAKRKEVEINITLIQDYINKATR